MDIEPTIDDYIEFNSLFSDDEIKHYKFGWCSYLAYASGKPMFAMMRTGRRPKHVLCQVFYDDKFWYCDVQGLFSENFILYQISHLNEHIKDGLKYGLYPITIEYLKLCANYDKDDVHSLTDEKELDKAAHCWDKIQKFINS